MSAPGDDDSAVAGLKREVAALWASYRRGVPLTPLAPPTDEAEALRVLEAQQRALAEKRTALRAHRDRQRAASARWAPAVGGVAALGGAALAAGLAVFWAPSFAAWVDGPAPATGLGLVVLSLVCVSLSTARSSARP